MDQDYTEKSSFVMPLTAHEPPADTLAPPSQFSPGDGNVIWEDARRRSSTALPGQGSGFFDASERMPEGFKVAKHFRSEDWLEDENGRELNTAITADQAERTEKQLLLTNMKITSFIGRAMLDKPQQQKKPHPAKATPDAAPPAPPAPTPSAEQKATPKTAKAHAAKSAAPPGANAPAAATGQAATVLASSLPVGGRVVISAPHAEIDIDTNEGHATGHVTVEIIPKDEPGKRPATPMAVLETDHLNWRTWNEPSLGSTELAAYTCGEGSNDPDPPVTGTFYLPQDDGTTSTMVIEGRGIILEIGAFDRLEQVFDEDGHLAGLSKTAHNRAFFHKQIKMVTTASSVKGIMPYQQPGAPAANGNAAGGNAAAQPQAPAAPVKKLADPYQTEITCDGPAILDMASIPCLLVTAPDAATREILLAKRFEFLNRVTMTKVPLDPVTGEVINTPDLKRSHMSCGDMCMQYPPGEMPSPSTPPEYAEAIVNVFMEGLHDPDPIPGQPLPPPAPFKVKCQRVYLDGPADNLFLVGSPDNLAYVLNDKVETTSQQFNFRSVTQTMATPSTGPKRMLIRAPVMPTPPPENVPGPAPVPENGQPAPPPPGVNMTSGDTIINWTGTLTREIKHLPVPQQPDIEEEVLLVKQDVVIEKPESGLKMQGDIIRIIRTLPDENVIWVDGVGSADVLMGDMHAIGDTFSVNMEPDLTKSDHAPRQYITVIGNKKEGIPATAFSNFGASAVRAQKFNIDQIANTFEALGGAVAVVHKPEQPPPQTDPAAGKSSSEPRPPAPFTPRPDAPASGAPGGGGLFTGMSFQPGGNIWIQCDGVFWLDGANHTGLITKNVIIKQPGMQMLSDEAHLVMEDPPPPGNPANPAAGGNPGANGAKPAPAPAAQSKPASGATPQTPAPPPPNVANSLFSGDLKSIDSIGNVEVLTDTQFVQCDRLFHDVATDLSRMFMNDPQNDVRIYRQEDSGNTQLISVVKCLEVNGQTGGFVPGGEVLMIPYRKELPAARARESSPARHKLVEARK